MTSQHHSNDSKVPELAPIHRVLLAPAQPDPKLSRWRKLAQYIRCTVRAVLGLRPAELADRYFEAKVAEQEAKAEAKSAEANLRLAEAEATRAEAAEIISRVIQNFDELETRRRSSSHASGGSMNSLLSLDPRHRKATEDAAMERLREAIELIRLEGGSVEIRVAEGDTSNLGESL